MNVTAVLLGHHIGYSASPAMHNAAFEALGMDARYELADVDAHGLVDAVAALRRPERIGANVTQPHKLAVCDLVDKVTPPVERLGAANTIVHEDGRLVAHNTDLPAVAAELGELGPLRRAVVLGNGGASRAVQAALDEAGVEMTVVDREHWTRLPSLLADADLLVNATPIGTGSNETPVDEELLRPDLAVVDLVYRPTPTRLVREARAAGATAHGGAQMLLRQAVMSFELWTGRDAPVRVMAEALRLELGADGDA
jgi:shikimate dehydrogenase